MSRHILCLLLLFPALFGCGVKELGQNLKYDIQGEHFLGNEDFRGGADAFARALAENPNNARVRYYYGRFLLADQEERLAIEQLSQAVALAPDNGDHHFWLGMALGEAGDPDAERDAYRQALRHDPQHLQALIHLGHNLLQRGDYPGSLANYQQALQIIPAHPQALYNRGVILHHLQRTPEERLAWLFYLDMYPSGAFARLAADRLNALQDYSYRNHRLGIRTLTLTDIGFLPFSDQIAAYAKPSLDLVGTTTVNMKQGNLNILVYQLNNLELARKRAIAIRNYLYQRFPELQTSQRIRTSWFDTAEILNLHEQKLTIEQSVRFFWADHRPTPPGKTRIKAEKFKKK
jgi:tetratricopeptide (TPR) repeat protein